MKVIKPLDLIAIENLIQNNLQDVNRSLGIGRLNNLLEVQVLQPKQKEVEPTEDKIYFGIVGDKLFKLWANTLECASQIIEEIVTLNSANSEELEISQEQVKFLTQELVAESQKVGFLQEEVEFCNKEIETLNSEIQHSNQLQKSER